MPEQTSAGFGSFLQYLAGNLRRNGRSPVRVYTGFVIAWALFFLFWTVLPPFLFRPPLSLPNAPALRLLVASFDLSTDSLSCHNTAGDWCPWLHTA